MKNEFDLLHDEHSAIQIWNLVDFLRNSEWNKMNHDIGIVEKDMIQFFNQYKLRRNKTNEGLEDRNIELMDNTRNKYWPGRIA